MVRLILILILISNITLAQSAQFLPKGQPAPFAGDLLTEDQTKQLYNDSLDKSSLQKQLDLETQNNALQEQKVTILQNQNAELLKANNEEHTLSDLEKVGCFILGVAVTGLAISAATQLK